MSDKEKDSFDGGIIRKNNYSDYMLRASMEEVA